GVVACGNGAVAGGSASTAGGKGAVAAGSSLVAGGNGATPDGSGAVAGGNGATAGGNELVAGGSGATAGGSGVVAGGIRLTADGNGVVARGKVPRNDRARKGDIDLAWPLASSGVDNRTHASKKAKIDGTFHNSWTFIDSPLVLTLFP